MDQAIQKEAGMSVLEGFQDLTKHNHDRLGVVLWMVLQTGRQLDCVTSRRPPNINVLMIM